MKWLNTILQILASLFGFLKAKEENKGQQTHDQWQQELERLQHEADKAQAAYDAAVMAAHSGGRTHLMELHAVAKTAADAVTAYRHREPRTVAR